MGKERFLVTHNFSRAIPQPFGAANWVTLVRAIFAAALLGGAAGAAWGGLVLGEGVRWAVTAGAAAALALDGIDGALARRLGRESRFGARFDMETDSATILALALLVWLSGQAGAWVLLSGLLRYGFLAAGWLAPALAAPLPPRRRRQTVCVAQMAALILALAPPITGVWGARICLAGLMLLGYSFASDVAWLARRKSEAAG